MSNSFFYEHSERGIGECFIKQSETVDAGHGRIETRSYTVCSDTGWLEERHHWLGLKAVVMVQSKSEIKGDVKTVRQFYIASLNREPEEMATFIRNHWQIENNLHWVMDVIFRQDECRIRKGDAAANFTTIKHAAINLLRRDPGKMSIPQKRHSAAWDDDYMYKIITQGCSVDSPVIFAVFRP